MKVSRLSIILIIFVLIAVPLWLWGINLPHVGIYNANNNYLTLAAKNFDRFGFLSLRGLPTYTTSSDIPINTEDYYLHHPILFFWISSLFFNIFGFANWVSHAATIIFALLTMVMIYKIARILWGINIAKLSLLSAFIFPMSSFFYKYMFFEQITLFLSLVIVYCYVKFVKTNKSFYLYYIGVVSFINGLSDWYGAYLLFPFIVMLFGKFKKKTLTVLKYYIFGLTLSIIVFFLTLFSLNNIPETLNAVLIRSSGSELLKLSFWQIRLFLLTAIRIAIYFTPVSLVSLYWIILYGKKAVGNNLKISILFFLFILGILNIIFLPTASWGHGYFLYYLVPFFAITSGLFLLDRRKNSKLFLFFLVTMLVTSVVINYLKMYQVKKQVWKYNAAVSFVKFVDRHQKILVVNFPGDVFEQYFLVGTEPVYRESIVLWLAGDDKFSDIKYAVIACAGDCNNDERMFIEALSKDTDIATYSENYNNAWLVRKKYNILVNVISVKETEAESLPDSRNNYLTPIIRTYRLVRDFLGGVQI